MNRFKRLRSLQIRILFGVIAVLFVTIGGLFYLLRVYYGDRQARSIQNYADYLSHTVENSFDFAMSVHNMEGLHEAVKRLDADTSIRQIILVDENRKVVMASPKDALGTTIPADDPICQVCHSKQVKDRKRAVVFSADGRQVLRVAVPIRNEARCFQCHEETHKTLGMVILDYSLEQVKGALSPGVMGMGTLFALTMVGMILAIGLLMNRLVTKRLNRLNDAVQRIGRGEFSHQLEVSDGDEIDRLSMAFNDMARRLDRFTQKIAADRDFLNRLINSIEDEIVVLDQNFEIVAANQAATATSADMTGKTCKDVCKLHGTSQCGNRGKTCLVAETFRTGQSQRKICTCPVESRDRYIEVVTTPVQTEKAEVRQVVCVYRDVTAWRTMERQLIRSERLAALGRLAAGVAHEINNPQAAIAACAEGLQRRLHNGNTFSAQDLDELPDYLRTIRNAAYQTKEIAGRLLNLSRSTDVDIQRVSVNAIVNEVVDLIQHEARSQNKTIRVDLHPDLPEISADRARLAHALSNLVRNSLDATTRGDEVRIATQPKENGLQIVVEDNGCGIPPADLERIFEPFFTTKAPGKGTGLGLSISERTIRDHGGTIEVESQVGVGTSFAIFLPV